MDAERLKEITTAANDAVKDLPADLKQSAFQTILNKLLETGITKGKNIPQKGTPKAKKKYKKSNASKPNEFDELTKKLIAGINRTEYPLMFNLKNALDKSLYTLKIAKDKLNIDGLLPSQVSAVLWDNFRLKTTQYAVSMQLMNAKKYVNRKQVSVKGGVGYKYHLAHEGEKYIDTKLAEMNTSDATTN
ncbi:MAG: hypothetical protein Q7J54_01885 [Candidatus Woesearchaeota archaeon]|nr:hypothetical protein [Candidatus Woesearchaeota archaeon]